MKRYKTLIVEDNLDHIEIIVYFLRTNHSDVIDVDSIMIADSFEKAKRIIDEGNKFDLTILDWVLPNTKTAQDLINEYSNTPFGVIALSSADDLGQIELNNRIVWNVDKILELPKIPTTINFKRFIKKLLDEYPLPNEIKNEIYIELYEIPNGDFIKLSDILCIRSLPKDNSETMQDPDGKYYQLFYKNSNMKEAGHYSKRGQLKEILAELNYTKLVQCHKSWIINIDKIMNLDEDGLIILFHKPDLNIPIGNHFKDELYKKIKKV